MWMLKHPSGEYRIVIIIIVIIVVISILSLNALAQWKKRTDEQIADQPGNHGDQHDRQRVAGICHASTHIIQFDV
jgi:hypothetical protein